MLYLSFTFLTSYIKPIGDDLVALKDNTFNLINNISEPSYIELGITIFRVNT